MATTRHDSTGLSSELHKNRLPTQDFVQGSAPNPCTSNRLSRQETLVCSVCRKVQEHSQCLANWCGVVCLDCLAAGGDLEE